MYLVICKEVCYKCYFGFLAMHTEIILSDSIALLVFLCRISCLNELLKYQTAAVIAWMPDHFYAVYCDNVIHR